MQAALVMFQHAALPVDAMQVELLRMLGTGFVAASITAWTLKACAAHDNLLSLLPSHCMAAMTALGYWVALLPMLADLQSVPACNNSLLQDQILERQLHSMS